VLASGDAEGGGSGFQEMVEYSQTDPAILNAEIVGVVSHHADGGVVRRARKLKIPFHFWPGPFTAEGYQGLVQMYQPDFVMCSGWLKLVRGLRPDRTINIHPGPLPKFGGPGMWGHHVHEAVKLAYDEGRIKQSAVTMHFVTAEYDRGPTIWQFPVFIRPEDTPDSIANRVNQVERAWQSHVLNRVVQGDIWLGGDGKVYYRGE